MARAIVPILDDFVARGVMQLIAQRRSAGPFVISEKGRYFDVFAGWRGQLTLLRQRLVDEVRARRLPTADGKALLELCASEFFAEIDPAPQSAIGAAILVRPAIGDGGRTSPLIAGTIKEGTRFQLRADPDASPPVKAATYVAREAVFVPADAPSCHVNLIATQPGPEANRPMYSNAAWASIELADTVFDPTFVVPSYAHSWSAGGSSDVEPDDLRHLARALYTGQHSPTDGALLAGALTSAAVKHVALVRDTVHAQTKLFIADASWAWSQAFQDQCTQILKDKWLGWGARLQVNPIFNMKIALSAKVILADPKFGDDTTELRAAIRTQVRKYLDGRPDFYTFDVNAIGGIIAAADSRILSCTGVEVKDPSDGMAVHPSPLTRSSSTALHYVLPDNGISLQVVPPQ